MAWAGRRCQLSEAALYTVRVCVVPRSLISAALLDRDYSSVAVFHPPAGDGPATAVFGWVSYVGAVTGYSESVTVGEKFWNGVPSEDESLYGQPWTFMTRDVLAAPNYTTALSVLEQANRTCAVMLGIGDAERGGSGDFTGAQVSARNYTLFEWDTDQSHPDYPGVVCA
jgi:hypothetical protein